MRGQRNVCESNYGMESFSGVGWWHKTAVSPEFRRSSSRLSSFCGSQKSGTGMYSFKTNTMAVFIR